MEHGWRVWISLCACIADRYRKDSILAAVARRAGVAASNDTVAQKAATLAVSQGLVHANISSGISHIMALLFRRIASDKPKITADLRTNLLRTIKFGAERFAGGGAPLAAAALAAVPLISLLRTVARQQAYAAAEKERALQQQAQGGAASAKVAAAPLTATAATAAGTATAAPGPPPYTDVRVEPLKAPELWAVLDLLVRALPSFAGLWPPSSVPQITQGGSSADAGMPPPPSVTISPAALVCKPDPHGFAAVLSLLHDLTDDEMAAALPSIASSSGATAAAAAEAAAAAGWSATSAARDVGSALFTAFNKAAIAVQAGAAAPPPVAVMQYQGSDSSVQPSPMAPASASSSIGGRLDAQLFLLAGLQATLECATVLSAVIAQHQTTTTPTAAASAALQRISEWTPEVSALRDGAAALTVVLANHCSWGPWGSAIELLSDSAYASGTGLAVPRGFCGALGDLMPAAAPELTAGTADGTAEAPSSVSSGVLPPALDRSFALTLALAPALREGLYRLRAAPLSPPTPVASSGGESAAVPTPVSVSAPIPPQPAPTMMSGIQREASVGGFSSSSAAARQQLQAQGLGGGVASGGGAWLADVLSADQRALATHAVPVPVDETLLRLTRLEATKAETLRIAATIEDVVFKARMMDTHWASVRSAMTRHARLLLAARARSLQAVAESLSMRLIGEDGSSEADASPLPPSSSPTQLQRSVSFNTPSDVLPPVKMDSNETQWRHRVRLLAVRAPPIVALTYEEYGKASGSAARRAASAAALSSVQAQAGAVGDASAASTGADSAAGLEFAKRLARAGAIKDVGAEASEAPMTEDSGAAAASAEDDALAAARGAGGDEDDGVAGQASHATDDEDDEDEDEFDRSVVSSPTSTAVSSVPSSVRQMTPASADAAAAAAKKASAAAAAVAAAAANEQLAAANELSATSGASAPGAAGSAPAVTTAARAELAVQGVKSARASLVKVGGYAPGTLHLKPDGSLLWTPRPPEDKPDPSDDDAHWPDPDGVAAPRRPRRWHARDITGVFLRCFKLTDSAAELFITPYGGPRRRRYLFAFEGGAAKRDDMLRAIIALIPRGVIDRMSTKLGLGGGGGALLDAVAAACGAAGSGVYGGLVGRPYLQVCPWVEVAQAVLGSASWHFFAVVIESLRCVCMYSVLFYYADTALACRRQRRQARLRSQLPVALPPAWAGVDRGLAGTPHLELRLPSRSEHVCGAQLQRPDAVPRHALGACRLHVSRSA
jgi:hypothetical protein